MRISKYNFIFLAGLTFFSLNAGGVLAQTEDCGRVVYPADFYYEGSEEEIYPINDCDNPFNQDEDPGFTYGLSIAEQSVIEDDAVIIDSATDIVSGDFFIDHPDLSSWRAMSLYRHEESDRVAVAVVVGNESKIGTKTDFNFTSSISPGTYTAVFTVESAPILSEAQSWWVKVLSYTAHTAEAFYADYVAVAAVTFTVVEETKGASSVLFLPGIQASFLAKDSVLGEDQVWPPNSLFSGDVEDLTMDDAGQSREDIYTTGIIDTTTGVGDIYAGFATTLNSLVGDTIAGWTPFAYDWRYSVDDLAQDGTAYRDGIRRLTDEVEYLAAGSFSGRVTVIGHSNGGLLAKALLKELEVAGKANLVDKVILLASPQLGTPKAIGTILHGYDQTDALGGVIIDAHPTRAVINNMPGAYGLLPSPAYFSGLAEPIITFSAGERTAPYVAEYGESISTVADFKRFLEGNDGLGRSIEGSVSEPAPVNPQLLENASLLHQNILDTWVAPAGVTVIEVVGTGLTTMQAVEYRDLPEEKCTTAGPAGVVCATDHYLKPYAQITAYGDGTVVQRSAEGYSGEKQRYFVNLGKIEEDNNTDIEYAHHNITEVPELQNFYRDLIISGISYETPYVSTIHTEFTDEYDLEIIDSPVRILTTDELGRQTGVEMIDGVRYLRNDIPNSQYFEFGDTKYLVVLKGTVRNTLLTGEAYGGYTLTTATLTGADEQSINTELRNASVTPQLRVEYQHDGVSYSPLAIDFDGDGVVDKMTTLTGEELDLPAGVTYDQVRAYIVSLPIKTRDKKVWLGLLTQSEKASKQKRVDTRPDKADRLLYLLKRLAHQQVKKGTLTEEQGRELDALIIELIATN